MTFIIALIILVVVVLAVVGLYNRLVSLRVRSENAWSDIDVQLKRRADLVPNLVNTVKGYAAHEKETLEGVTEARAKATSMNIDPSKATPDQVAAFQKAQGQLSQALGRLMGLSEKYPD